jgi:hypothetical protein
VGTRVVDVVVVVDGTVAVVVVVGGAGLVGDVVVTSTLVEVLRVVNGGLDSPARLLERALLTSMRKVIGSGPGIASD